MAFLYYFAYGSNMLSERLQRRVPSAQSHGCALLTGFGLRSNKVSHDGSSKYNMVMSKKENVYGVLFRMSAAELHLLDKAEGRGHGYERFEASVEQQHKSIPAFFYLAQPDFINDELSPYRWYVNFAYMGALEHQLPLSYQHTLKSWPSIGDRKVERRLHNEAIIEAALQKMQEKREP